MSEDKETNKANDQTEDTKNDITEKSHPETGSEQVVASDAKNATAENSAKPKQKRQRKSGSKRPFPWVSTTILLLIMVLGAGNFWQYQQGQILKQSQARFTQQLSDATTSIMSLDSQLNETTDQQKSLAQKAQSNEQNQQALQATLEQMSQQLKELAIAKGKEPLFWKVSEVEYLLSVANHRLILEKDVSTAKTALQDADTRLRAIGDPGLIPVRNKVADEIGQLKQVKLPDIAGMASQLGSIAGTIDTLPFIKNIRALDSIEKPELPTETDTSFSFISRVVKDIANGLFTIQRTNEPVEPLLPPQEKQYLKHNLNLKIEEARIALLNQETALFHKNLTAVEDWTKKYFNEQDPSVATMLQSVSELKQVELQPSLPDISHSLRDLRAWMNQQKQAAIDTKGAGTIGSGRVSTLASTKHDNSAGLLP